MTRTELLTVAKPILMNADMTRSALENRKRATRRLPRLLDKSSPVECIDGQLYEILTLDGQAGRCKIAPPHRAGDILYVREAWYFETHMYDPSEGDALHRYVYRASSPDYPVNIGAGRHGWRPSIHMPKEAARLFLRVTNVRPEQLQDVTEEQIIAEGIVRSESGPLQWRFLDSTTGAWLNFATGKEAMARLWDSTIPARALSRKSWNANPWVWAIQFERVIPDDEEKED